MEVTKKVKKVKDPNAPKKGMTAFLHYVTTRANPYKKEHPGMAHKDVISKMGSIWKSLSDEDKSPYEKLAVQDKKKYEEAKKAYEKK